MGEKESQDEVQIFHLKLYQKSEDDSASVQLWVDEAERFQGNENSLFRLPASQRWKHGHIVFENHDWIPEKHVELSDKAICVDGTHHLTQYKHQLVTVQIIDENGNGFPCAWFITPSEKCEYLEYFFYELILYVVLLRRFCTQHTASIPISWCQGFASRPYHLIYQCIFCIVFRLRDV